MTFTRIICWRTSTFRKFVGAYALGAGLLLMMPALAHAQCPQWDVGGQWTMVQGSFRIPVQLSQSGKAVTGNAVHDASIPGEPGSFGTNVKVSGSISGRVEGDVFDVEIDWPDGLVGIYRGSVDTQGNLSGITFNKNKPASNATWYGDRKMKCQNTTLIKPSTVIKASKLPPPTEPKPAPRVIARTGRAPAAGGTSVNVPNIIAFNKPRQAPGTRTLTWDGGPDHPYAEVWVKVDGGDETFVVEQGKGTREVTVEAGKTYLYILTDAGTTLATITVKAQ